MVWAEFVYNSAEFPPLNSAELTRSSTEHAQQKPFSAAAASSAVKPTPPDSEKFFLAGSNSTSIGTTNTINGRPTIIFSDAETQSLAANFRYALVGKFSHGSPPYSQLHRLLYNSGIKEAFTVSLINNKHALINLTNETDYSRLWMRRIWFLKGLPMRVFKWSPTFIPDQESSIVPVWVRFPDLPAHLFRKDALHTIAKFVGVPLQIADSTFSRSMLSRARVCIEIDLLKPLVNEIDLQIYGTTFVQKVEYEQLPPYCLLCKHVGHHELECYTKGSAPKPPPRAKQTKDKTVVQNSTEKGECSKTHEFIIDENDEHATVNDNDENVEPVTENAIVEALMEENNIVETLVETIVEESVEHTLVENEHEKVDDYDCGALIVRPNIFLRENTSIDIALKIVDAVKQFGRTIMNFEEDIEMVIKRNKLAVRSAILYQKCVMIFDRVSQLYLKPLDERSPPIATRTRHRKKGKKHLEPPDDIHYF
ncbi:UNVERIFIED_CONTAM: hypothetical protein Sradi_3466400 [Sesamum radiatum]|uniref:DUF4283 domain-containing protein n=1 Tax=Sesamum radiatum TaxID=300843 RepID=A0AAW2R5K7_SESRA